MRLMISVLVIAIEAMTRVPPTFEIKEYHNRLSKQIPESYCTFAKCAACEKAYRNDFNDFTKIHENVCIALWIKPYCCDANLRNGLTFYAENYYSKNKIKY